MVVERGNVPHLVKREGELSGEMSGGEIYPEEMSGSRIDSHDTTELTCTTHEYLYSVFQKTCDRVFDDKLQ